MSGKKTRDYKAVLNAVRELLSEEICVQEVMIDFEAALWKSLATVFPGVAVKGCCFYWKSEERYRKPDFNLLI